jgi:flagellar motor switch protein FliG
VKELLTAEEQPTPNNAHARLGAILNNLERDQTDEVLRRLSAADAAKVRNFIFSFEDLGTLTVEDRSKLFDAAGSEQLILALRGCDGEFAEMVLSALSPRSRRVVESELSAGATPPPKAVAQARRNIAAKAIELAENSAIKLRSATVIR